MTAVCLVAMFQVDLKQSHGVVVKIFFRYLKGMDDFGLWYPKDDDFTLSSFIDANW